MAGNGPEASFRSVSIDVACTPPEGRGAGAALGIGAVGVGAVGVGAVGVGAVEVSPPSPAGKTLAHLLQRTLTSGLAIFASGTLNLVEQDGHWMITAVESREGGPPQQTSASPLSPRCAPERPLG